LAAHIKQRKDRGFTWYLVDGPVIRSLHTTKKGLAQHQLEQYIKGKYGLAPTPTVGEFYERWIKTKIEPLFRRSLIRAYHHHFNRRILPAFKGIRLAGIGIRELTSFQVDLLGAGLKVKSCRNIIDGSFRALYRDARIEIEELSGKDPFMDLRWPASEREKPDPFLAEIEQQTEMFTENPATQAEKKKIMSKYDSLMEKVEDLVRRSFKKDEVSMLSEVFDGDSNFRADRIDVVVKHLLMIRDALKRAKATQQSLTLMAN